MVRIGTALFGATDRRPHALQCCAMSNRPAVRDRVHRRRQHGARADQRPACAGHASPSTIRVGEAVARGARSELAREFGVSATADNARAPSPAPRWWCWRSSRRMPRRVLAAAAPLPWRRAVRSLLRSPPASASQSLRSWCRRRRAGACAPCPTGPALVGAGVTGLYAPPQVTAAQRELRGAGAAARWARSCGSRLRPRSMW